MRKFHRNSNMGDWFQNAPKKKGDDVELDMPKGYSQGASHQMYRPGNQSVQRVLNDKFNKAGNRVGHDEVKTYEIDRILDLASLGFDDDHIAEVCRIPVEEIGEIIERDAKREAEMRATIIELADSLR